MQTLADLQAAFNPNSAEAARYINEECTRLTNQDPRLKELRDFVEANVYGMGERSFFYMWKLIIQELGPSPNMLEIGVHRGQIIALWRILSPDSYIFGLSPFNGEEMGVERDYTKDVELLFDGFNLKRPNLILGHSDNEEMIRYCRELFTSHPEDMLDVLYIDGGHSYETATSDIVHYSEFVKPGGYMVIDDSANGFACPQGYFPGIASVSKAADHLLPPAKDNPDWEHIGAVMHNRIWRKKN